MQASACVYLQQCTSFILLSTQKQFNDDCPYGCSFVELRRGTKKCVHVRVKKDFLSCTAPYVLNSWSLCISRGVCNDTLHRPVIYCNDNIFSRAQALQFLLLVSFYSNTSQCQCSPVLACFISRRLNSSKHTHTHLLHHLHFPQSQYLKCYLSEQTGPCCFHGPLCCLVNARLFPWEIKERLWAFSAPKNCVAL